MQHFLEQLDMQPKSNRLEHIDILKGLLIILVVIGHIGGIPTLHKYIYWFHMPCFFILSGYVFKPDVRGNVYKLVQNRICRYMIPCYMWWFILQVVLGTFTLQGILHILWGGRLVGGVYWYISCLTLTQILFFILLKINSSKKICNNTFIVCTGNL